MNRQNSPSYHGYHALVVLIWISVWNSVVAPAPPNSQTYSISEVSRLLENRPVTVSPSESSCTGPPNVTHAIGNYITVCLPDCPRRYPQLYEPKNLIGSGSVTFGSANCELRRAAGAGPTTIPPSRRRRRQAAESDPCFISVLQPQSPKETFTFWITPEAAEGSVAQILYTSFTVYRSELH